MSILPGLEGAWIGLVRAGIPGMGVDWRCRRHHPGDRHFMRLLARRPEGEAAEEVAAAKIPWAR